MSSPAPPSPGSSAVKMAPYSYTWIFALQMIVCFIDAFGIGANDVANSFAPSVSARSVTLAQAMGIAAVMEFVGAVSLGASVQATIKDGIISTSYFAYRPDLLMMGFFCAISASCLWLLTATRLGWPVSSTQSIVCSLAGVGISGFGFGAVNWGWNGKGIAQIAAAWFTSPIISALLASIIYLVTLNVIMKSKDSLRRGIYAIPVYFTLTAFILAFYITSKNGSSSLFKTSGTGGTVSTSGNVALAFGIIGAATFLVLVFCVAFICPFFYRRLVKEERLQWYEVFYIWLVPERPHDDRIDMWLKQCFTPHLLTEEEREALGIKPVPEKGADVEAEPEANFVVQALKKIKRELTKGLTTDVASLQTEKGDGEEFQYGGNALKAREVAIVYDNKTEYLFSMLQVATAALASFAHGSNEVANATGTTAGVLQIWQTGGFQSNVNSPVWLLAYGGAGLSVGLAIWGYRVMLSLGNYLTYHSPSRGFAMELGTALAVITGSFLGLPISNTHCIVGATIGVGLCQGKIEGVNWRPVIWFISAWLLTLPFAALASGCLFAFVTRGPSFTLPPS